jgi:sucrose-6F-phosphate phosphohydrolase
MFICGWKAAMKPFLFVSDLDHTLVGTNDNDDEALSKLNQKLAGHREEFGTKVVYATGRSLELYRELKNEKKLLAPDALITAVGTEIYFDSESSTPIPDSDWFATFNEGWDAELIKKISSNFVDLVPQKPSEQRKFKVSYNISEKDAKQILPELKTALHEKGLKFQIVYSGGKDLDILPLRADKGLAVQFLQQKWMSSKHSTVVCGDSGNDIALFKVGEVRGVIVGNAQDELLKWYRENPREDCYLANAFCAAGILEGLVHHGFLQ